MTCVLGLDIGTTSTTGALIRLPGTALSLASRPVSLRSERIGWAEEDPEQWWTNVCEIVRQLLNKSGASAAEVAAIGVSGMLPAVVLLDSTGRLLRPSIQQSDARCAAEVAELRSEIEEAAFLAKAGNGIKGDVLLKFGGAVDILLAADRAKPDPRLYLDYHLIPGLFAPNGCMATGGSARNWFARNFAGGEAAVAEKAGFSTHQWLDLLAGARPAGSEGLVVTPYFLGEKTPIHDPNARATFDGLTLAHDVGHIWRAMLEAYAYAIAHHVEVMNEIGYRTVRFIASDGGSASLVWMQIVADVLQQSVQRLAGHPGSCIGAAWTAAVGAGLADEWAGISAIVRPGDRIDPRTEFARIYSDGYRRYREIYRRLAETREPNST